MSIWRWLTGTRRAPLDHDRLAAGDPWVRLPWIPPLPAFGPGAREEFTRYLEGPSRIEARSPLDVAHWLLACRYAEDLHLHDEVDHWQHPTTFELVRSGDCEDYSLWAWRKLVEASYEAAFVVGMHHRPDGQVGRHAWVTFSDGHEEFLLDGVQRSVALIVRPRAAVAQSYVPQVGVDPAGRRFIYAGLFRSTWGRRLPVVRHPDE